MADISGMAGDASLPTDINLSVQGWSANFAHDMTKIEPAFGEMMRVTDLGAAEFTGSLTFKLGYNAANTQPFDPTGTDWTKFKGSVVLTATTGCTYTFNAVLSNFQMDRPHGGAHTGTCDFANSDQVITVAWDETP